MSVFLHELFHVFMHWGNVVRVDIFPSNGNIAQVVATGTTTANEMLLEEIVAYSITAVAIVSAVLIASKIWRGKNVKSKHSI